MLTYSGLYDRFQAKPPAQLLSPLLFQEIDQGFLPLVGFYRLLITPQMAMVKQEFQAVLAVGPARTCRQTLKSVLFDGNYVFCGIIPYLDRLTQVWIEPSPCAAGPVSERVSTVPKPVPHHQMQRVNQFQKEDRRCTSVALWLCRFPKA